MITLIGQSRLKGLFDSAGLILPEVRPDGKGHPGYAAKSQIPRRHVRVKVWKGAGGALLRRPSTRLSCLRLPDPANTDCPRARRAGTG